MNFHDLVISYEWFKKTDPRVAALSLQEFYRQQRTDALSYLEASRRRDAIAAYNQASTELDWHNRGRPYYKIYPALLPMFLNTKLDVPGKYLHAPFSSFLIRLPQGHGCEGLTAEGRELQLIFVTEVAKGDTLELLEPIEHEHMFILWMNFGEVYEGMPYYIFQTMKFRPGESIESAVNRQRQPEKVDQESLSIGIDITDEIINNCVRLTASVCFLATGADRIVEPDVLTRDLQRYIEAKRGENPERVQQLHDRAQRRGKQGWTLGREILVPTRYQSSDGGEPTGEHLAYQHQRGAHFHIYHYGPGKNKWKVKWVNQLTVRPDLPAPPIKKRGYKAK